MRVKVVKNKCQATAVLRYSGAEHKGPCCIAGTCQFGTQCPDFGTIIDAAADMVGSDVADASAD